MSFGYTVLGFGSHPNRSSPLEATTSGTDQLEMLGISPGSSRTSSAGEIDVTCSAQGGSGSYTFSWAVAEASDPDNAVTIAAAGTQNVANYNTLRLTGSNADPPPNPAEYRLSCTVSDGVDSVTVHHMITVMIA